MSNTKGPIGPNEEIKVSKIETFVLKNSWVFVKISTDAGITGWGEMLKDDAKACAAGALEVANYLVGKDPRPVVHHWQAIHRGAFYRGGPIKPPSPPVSIWHCGISLANAMVCRSTSFWVALPAIEFVSTARSTRKRGSTP